MAVPRSLPSLHIQLTTKPAAAARRAHASIILPATRSHRRLTQQQYVVGFKHLLPVPAAQCGWGKKGPSLTLCRLAALACLPFIPVALLGKPRIVFQPKCGANSSLPQTLIWWWQAVTSQFAAHQGGRGRP